MANGDSETNGNGNGNVRRALGTMIAPLVSAFIAIMGLWLGIRDDIVAVKAAIPELNRRLTSVETDQRQCDRDSMDRDEKLWTYLRGVAPPINHLR